MTIKERDREILSIAVPAIVTNVTVPLLGLADMAIVGHMGNANYIGGIAVGAMVFNVICWLFGFLRMGTSGLTSQAFGRGSAREMLALLRQALAVGAGIGLAFVALQVPVRHAALMAMHPTEDTAAMAGRYFDICIYGVPATLSLYGLTGWYIGMQNTRTPMLVAVFQNVTNIVASLTFVYGLGMKIEGVAMGTVVAQYAGLAMGLWRLRDLTAPLRAAESDNTLLTSEVASLGRFFTVNRDIFLRTLFLVAVNFCFTAAGARQGTVILAVNTLLFQLFTLYSFVMDGFAYAGEALCGKYLGARDRLSFNASVGRLWRWCLGLTAIYTLVYLAGTMSFLRLMANNAQVATAARPYALWAAAIPLAGMGAFCWDGIYVGITATQGMLASTMAGACVFFLTWALLSPALGNHALWLALILYLAVRGMVLGALFGHYRRLRYSSHVRRDM